MRTEIVLEALNELKNDTANINDNYSLTDWKNKATNLMIRIYGKESALQNQIDELRYQPAFSRGGENNIRHRRQQAVALIESQIKEIERFGLPEIKAKEEGKSFHINITQNQQQNQETKISLGFLIDSIQEELKGSELKEIQTIIDDEQIEPETKKNKIVETLKKFGGDVATNIIANILTNPALYS
ncbi:hypothetical protein [Flavobacterium fluviale]|uniref:Uncharacterized protein n=1 Tax=Flavobacterium fluviale TaxID=2249356 RepID=A0A344LW84_9FLAO|nr:hypothetical protein [Flavobacterium fluviale]AXB58176.1 hypothetical protein HYN86_16910 [Flavobacterium fluviale]